MDRNINVKYPRYDEYDHCSVEEYNGTQFSLILKCHLLDVPFRPLLHRNPKNRCDFASKADSEVFWLFLFYPKALFLQKNIVMHDYRSSAPKRKQI